MSANLLLVEDDRDLADAIRLVLEDEDWRVEHVTDGLEGVRRAQSGEHDLLWQTERNTGSVPTVNVHIRNLRLKLGDDPEAARYIASIRGVGYMLIAEVT